MPSSSCNVNLVHFFFNSAFVRKMVRVPKMEITSCASGGGGMLCVCWGGLILFKHSYPLKIGAEENTPSIYGFDQRPIHSETTIILGITFLNPPGQIEMCMVLNKIDTRIKESLR